MSGPNDRITRNGKTLSRRVWALLADAGKAAGAEIIVVQGSWSGGVAASAGTHNGGGAFDLSVRTLSNATALRLVNELRKRNVAAWLRSPAYGWTSTGPHIHGIVKDEPGLSAGARAQVVSYNRGQNGLANHARDPFPRPAQHPFSYGVPHPSVPGAPIVNLANLKYGHTHDDVKDLQRALNAHLSGPDLPVTGFYGDQTDAAVRRCQAAHVPPADAAKHSSVGPRQAAHLGLKVG